MKTHPMAASVPQTDFKIFKTVNVGVGRRSAELFRDALKRHDCDIDYDANSILRTCCDKVETKEGELDLVAVKHEDLGLDPEKGRGSFYRPYNFTVGDVYRRAAELGLQFGPNELAAELRLQYADQSKEEILLVPLSNHAVFELVHNQFGERWLRSAFGCQPSDYSTARGNSNKRWVFVKPRK